MTRDQLASIHCSIAMQIRICTRAKALLQKKKCNTLCTALMTSFILNSTVILQKDNERRKIDIDKLPNKDKATVEHELFHKKTYSPVMIQAIIPACTYENAVKNCNANMDVHGFWWPLQTRYGKRNIQPRVEFLEFIVEELKRYK